MLGVVPVIKALRGRFLETAVRESKKRAKHFSDTDRLELETFTRSLINKLLHNPTIRLKELDRETSAGLNRLEAIRDLFDLEPIAGEENGPSRESEDAA